MEIELYPNQMKIFEDETRFRILSAGRRFGKTVLAVNELLKSAVNTPRSLNWYVAPTYKQAKMIAWKMLLDYVPRTMIAKTNETELSVTLVNGSEICLKGAENEDSLRGVGVTFCVLDELS